MPTGYNSQVFKNSLTTLDASVVSVLRSSGALIFAKTVSYFDVHSSEAIF